MPPIVNQVRFKPGRSGLGSIKVTTQPVRLKGSSPPAGNGPSPGNTNHRPGLPTTVEPTSR